MSYHSEIKELVDRDFLLPVTDWKEHKLFFLEKSAGGKHVLGGKRPKELVLPAHERMKTPFQYLGSIDGTDPLFSWMEIDKYYNPMEIRIWEDFSKRLIDA